MSTPEEWSRAFAAQAASDLAARDVLLGGDLPQCQQLHYLQMACEKVCKAHLHGTGADAEALQASHAYVAKVLPIIARQNLKSTRGHDWAIAQIRHLAREIELLAPAVDDGGRRPDNCEYPWRDGDRIRVPAERSFPNLDLLKEPAGRLLLKVVTSVARDLARSGTGAG